MINLSEAFNKNGKVYSATLEKLKAHEQYIIDNTLFLENATLLQRAYHLYNNIIAVPLCPICNSSCIWTKNRYLKTCGNSKCHHVLKAKNAGTTKKITGIAKKAYIKRNKTLLDIDKNALSNIAKKAVLTKNKNGNILSIASKKAAKTLQARINSDGFTGTQLRRLVQIETLKNTILPNGSTAFDNVGRNISKVLKNSEKHKQAMKTSGEKRKTEKPDGINSSATLAAFKGVEKCRFTKEQNGTVIPKHLLKSFKIYERNVLKETNKQSLHLIPNFDKRANHAHSTEAWHLDHRFSISAGFHQNISPSVIGHISNLEMLPWLDNLKKGSKCSTTLEELMTLYNSYIF